MSKNPMKVYFCGTDLTDISIGATDVIAYPTLKALKKHKKCLHECGYISAELTNIKVLKKWRLLDKADNKRGIENEKKA